jgi:hypothetical protein
VAGGRIVADGTPEQLQRYMPRIIAGELITAVGGSDRVVWMTTQQDPTRLDVFALVNRGPTPYDAQAALRLDASAGKVLPAVVAALRREDAQQPQDAS